ncbi:phosphotransferase family protein [Dactylosporangium sp. CA-092794]|uniref:phosphotransferase family protein n=1 Tax=Dactylosporangium sp. CA-092794 TaxID=3239929 RepID=UPI003D8B7535
MTETAIGDDVVRAALVEACPGVRVGGIRRLDGGHTSRQWVADTDEGRLLVKTPVRDPDPEHLRGLIAATRRAAEGGVPVVRFRAFVPRSDRLGAPLLVQEFQEGTPAADAWDGMDGGQRLAFAAELGRLVGRVHACAGDWYGDVLGTVKYPDARAFLHAHIDGKLAQAPGDLTSAGRDRLGAALHRAVDAVGGDDGARLVHRDMWPPNLLLRDGRIVCLLDFEHGKYADRFMEFGKLDEHVFAGFAEGRAAFLAAYDEVCPLPADWPARIRLGNAIHSLATCVYFRRWNPRFAARYAAELEEWLAGSA